MTDIIPFEAFIWNGIRSHVDDDSQSLQEDYDLQKITGPQGLTRSHIDDCAIWPFLAVAKKRGIIFGYDLPGYLKLISQLSKDEPDIMFNARERIKSIYDLYELAYDGLLEPVNRNPVDDTIFFPTKKLIKRSVELFE